MTGIPTAAEMTERSHRLVTKASGALQAAVEAATAQMPPEEPSGAPGATEGAP